MIGTCYAFECDHCFNGDCPLCAEQSCGECPYNVGCEGCEKRSWCGAREVLEDAE